MILTSDARPSVPLPRWEGLGEADFGSSPLFTPTSILPHQGGGDSPSTAFMTNPQILCFLQPLQSRQLRSAMLYLAQGELALWGKHGGIEPAHTNASAKRGSKTPMEFGGLQSQAPGTREADESRIIWEKALQTNRRTIV
jgi:hypothetical protein